MGTQRETVTFTKDTAVRRGLRALAAVLLAASGLAAADLDQDGLDDAWETANGYNTSLYTRIVYVDAVNGDDDAGDGGTAETALRSLGAALARDFAEGDEIVVLVAPGTYSGAANRGLDFCGRDIWLRASGGAAQTIIDLEGAGRLLSLTGGETLASRLDGFTVRNGYMASCGIAVHLENASLDIRGCVFEDNRSGRRETYDHQGICMASQGLLAPGLTSAALSTLTPIAMASPTPMSFSCAERICCRMTTTTTTDCPTCRNT